MEQVKLLNDTYEKLVEIGSGSGGKIYLAKVVGQIKKHDDLLQEMLQASNSQLPQQQQQQQQQKQEGQPEYIVLKKFYKNSHPSRGLQPDALHEIKFMKSLNSKNVVSCHDIFLKKKSYGDQSNLYIAMDFFLDLKDIQHSKLNFQDLRCIAKQMVQGVDYIHKQWVIHRDIKPSNTFLSSNGTVILGDFGLARTYGSPNREMSGNVVTRVYRPPEILYGAKIYADKVDIWSLAVSIAELFIEWPAKIPENERYLFNGVSEIDQLQKIFCVRGTPNEQNWPGCSNLPVFMEFDHREPANLKEIIPKLSDEGVEIIEKMLSLDPNKRPTAEECLQHPFFKNALEPEQTNLQKLSKQWHQEKLQKFISKAQQLKQKKQQ